MAVSLEQGCISSWFLLAPIWHQLAGGESDRSMTQSFGLWPTKNAEAVCPDWAPKVERGADQISQLWSGDAATASEEDPIKGCCYNKVTSRKSCNAPCSQLGRGCLLLNGTFVSLLLSASSTYTQQFIGQIGSTQCFSKLICLRINVEMFLETSDIFGFLPKKVNFIVQAEISALYIFSSSPKWFRCLEGKLIFMLRLHHST